MIAHNKTYSDEIDFTPDRITEKQRRLVMEKIDLNDTLVMLCENSSTFAIMTQEVY
jgi:hypothetical protein